jgi:cell division protease FtsH
MDKAKGEIRYALEDLCLFGFEYFYDYNNYDNKQCPERQKLIMDKMTEIISDWYEECKKILLENKDLLDRLANLLLEKKTLIWNDIKKLL